MGRVATRTPENRSITVDFRDEATYFRRLADGKVLVEGVLALLLALGFQRKPKAPCRGGGWLTRPSEDVWVRLHPYGSQQAFLTGLAHLYNLVTYQRRAQHGGQCGV